MKKENSPLWDMQSHTYYILNVCYSTMLKIQYKEEI